MAAIATSAVATTTQAVAPFAITTTFTAPTQCAQSIGGLTMLENDGFRIWLNAPLPVPGTTITSCYAPEFVSSFLLQTGGISQPAFSPLVCPAGYTTQGPFTSNYIACCPSGWDGFAPAPNAPPDRPAFGGTCFTNIFNVPIRITSYDAASVQASSIFTATNSNDQAFAYPYEGFALGVAVVASTTPAGGSSAPTTSMPSMLGESPDSEYGTRTMSGGAIAGIVLGSILAALLLGSILVFSLRYRSRRMGRLGFMRYDKHLRLGADSPMPMMYLKDNVKPISQFYSKGADIGAVNRYEESPGIFRELEGPKRATIYEMEAPFVPTTMTKSLPDLPTE